MNDRGKRDYNSEIEIEDVEEYRGDRGASKKEIVLRQLRKCMDEGSKQMTAGGVETRIINGRVIDIAVPNQIEIFVNSVDLLRVMLNEDFKKFPNIQQSIEKRYENIDKLEEAYYKKLNQVQGEFEQIERKDSKSYSQLTQVVVSIQKHFETIKQKEYLKVLTDICSYIGLMNWFEEDSIVWTPK